MNTLLPSQYRQQRQHNLTEIDVYRPWRLHTNNAFKLRQQRSTSRLNRTINNGPSAQCTQFEI